MGTQHGGGGNQEMWPGITTVGMAKKTKGKKESAPADVLESLQKQAKEQRKNGVEKMCPEWPLTNKPDVTQDQREGEGHGKQGTCGKGNPKKDAVKTTEDKDK